MQKLSAMVAIGVSGFALWGHTRVAFAEPAVFAPGAIFIDQHGSTVQVIGCKGIGYQSRCQVRMLEKKSSGTDYSADWWDLDLLRGMEQAWIAKGGKPYAGPPVTLPGEARAPATGPAPVVPMATAPAPSGLPARRVSPSALKSQGVFFWSAADLLI